MEDEAGVVVLPDRLGRADVEEHGAVEGVRRGAELLHYEDTVVEHLAARLPDGKI